MEKSVGESNVQDREKLASDALKVLLRQSKAVYNKVLESPVISGFSGWDSVQPRAVYDFTPPPPKLTPHKKAYQRLPRSLRHKPATAPPFTSYMSGELDENYSYVYTPGLSKRCRKELAENGKNPTAHLTSYSTLPSHPYLPHPSLPHPPVVYPSSAAPVQTTAHNAPKLFSTVYLDPNISQPPALKQKEAHLQSELAKVVRMQMKPELLVEQIIIENRLRALGGGMQSRSNQFLNLEGIGVDPRMIPNLDKGPPLPGRKSAVLSKSAPSLLPLNFSQINPQQAPKPPSKIKPKKKSKPPLLDWCTLHNPDSALSPGSSLQRTSGAIIASARKEVSAMNNSMLIKAQSSSPKTAKGTVGGSRPPPTYNVGDGFLPHPPGFRLPSLASHPLGSRDHAANKVRNTGQTKLRIT